MREIIFAFDGDGVILEFGNYLLGLIGSSHTADEIVSWDLFDLIEQWHGRATKNWALALCNTPDYWRNQPAMPGALEALTLIRDEFRQHNIRVKCITQPWQDCREWGHVRRKRLEELYDIPTRDIIEAYDKSGERADLFLDDKPSHLVSWNALNGRDGLAVAYDHPYNRPSSTPPFDWPERISWGSDHRVRALVEKVCHSARAR